MSDAGKTAPIPDAAATLQRSTNVRWMIFSLSCITSWLLYLHRYTWNVVSERLQTEQGWSNTETQVAYSIFSYTYGFAQVPAGMLCDYVGPHIFLGVIILVWSLIVPLQGAFTNMTLLGGTRLAFGAAQAGTYPILGKVSQVWFPPSYRTAVQGWIATFFGRSGGAMSSIIMATLLMGYFGMSWQKALIVMGAAGALFAVVFLLLFRNSPETDPRVNAAERAHIRADRAVQSTERLVMPWGKALKNRSMIFFIIQQVLIAGADTAYVSLMGTYFTSQGVDIKQSGVLVSLPMWGGAIGGMLGGFLNDRLIGGNKRSLLWLGALMGGVLGAFLSGIRASLSRADTPLAAGWAAQVGPIGLILGVALLSAGIGAVVICLLFPAAGSRRWGRSSIGLTGNVIGSLLLIVTIQQKSALAAGLALFAVKYFADMCQPTVWGAITDVGGRFSATVFGIINMAGNVSAIFCPLLFGLILDAWTTKTFDASGGLLSSTTDYRPLIGVLAGMYVIGGLCWLQIDCTRTLEAKDAA